jgi:PAS domain S-box-containing protein
MSTVNHYFLANGGEMGALTRAKDWSKTPVGAVESWPQSLRTTLGILLNSKFPMFLFWGPDHICFYNDAYRPSLGNDGKHPAILGQKGAEYWPEIWEFIKPLIDQVLNTGEATWHEDQLLPIYRNGKMEDVYWTFSYSPVNNDEGKIDGVLVICDETTSKVNNRKNLENSNERYLNNILQTPTAMCIFRGKNYVVEIANELMLEIWERKIEDVLNRPVFEALPEVNGQGLDAILLKVYQTGERFTAYELPVKLNRNGKVENTYINVVYEALKEPDGTISGIVAIANDVTYSVKARYLLAQSEKAFRNLVIDSPIAMAIFRGKDHIIEMANNAMMKTIWQKKKKETIGKTILEVFPELLEQKYPELLDQVILNKKVVREIESLAYVKVNGELKKFYLDYQYTPLLEKEGEASGVMVTVNDVTSKVEARKKVEDAEERARLAVEIAEIATWDVNIATQELIYSENLATIFGHDKTSKITRPQIRNQVHSDDQQILEQAYKVALKTSIYKYEARVVKPDLSISWIKAHGKIFFDEKKQPIKMLGTIMDITDEKNNQQTLMESEQKFRLLADSMPQHIWTSDPMGNLNYFNQSVYTYSGIPVEEIDKKGWLQIVHPEDREENVNAWMEAVKTGNDFLLQHRFRRFDSEYRWQLSRAIAQKDSEGKIQMWVGTSTDIQDQKDFTSKLEKEVQERTAQLELKNKDLINMNIELQSFAYISSHDLQEPLRKIQTFASRLSDLDEQNISANAKTYLSRIEVAAKRMQTLIQDLLEYSRTNSAERIFVKSNLDDIAEEIKSDFLERIEEKNAQLIFHPLGEATIISFQFRQLLHNLIGNALKFSRKDSTPIIEIKAKRIKGNRIKHEVNYPDKMYYHLKISDNGIGFDAEYKDRIFEVFKRLNTEAEFAGTGIGLAIVKKIVENHKGIITASGKKNKGATFDIYIPELH